MSTVAKAFALASHWTEKKYIVGHLGGRAGERSFSVHVMTCDVTTNVFKRVKRINLIKIEIETTRIEKNIHITLDFDWVDNLSGIVARRRRCRSDTIIFRSWIFIVSFFFCNLSFFLYTISLVNPHNGKQDWTHGNYTVQCARCCMRTDVGKMDSQDAAPPMYCGIHCSRAWNTLIEPHSWVTRCAHSYTFFCGPLFVIHWSRDYPVRNYTAFALCLLIGKMHIRMERAKPSIRTPTAAKSIVNGVRRNRDRLCGEWRLACMRLRMDENIFKI